MKQSVYLDTTIPSYYFDSRVSLSIYVEATRFWWSGERQNFDIYTSDYTLVELERGAYPHQKEILTLSSGKRISTMFTPYNDPVVLQKHQAQESIMNEADGDLHKYNEIIRKQANELRKKSPGHFKTVSENRSLAA